MPTSRPFAYNTGSVVPGSIKFGDISIGFADIAWSERPGDIDWYMGPDEDLGYVICVPSVVFPPLRFYRTGSKTDQEFIDLTNGLFAQSFTNAWDARQWLIDNGYWTSWIYDAFRILVKTDNTGSSNNDQFTIPTSGGGYNYEVKTQDGQTLSGLTGTTTITFPSAGTYWVEIRGNFPRIVFNNSGDRRKLLEIQNWGTGVWSSFLVAFYGCENLLVNATDVPNLSNCTTFANMFRGGVSFINSNGIVGSWNTANLNTTTSLLRVFQGADFNQYLGYWKLNTNLSDASFIFERSGSPTTGMQCANFTDTIVAWANQVFENGGVPNNVAMTNQADRQFATSRSGGKNFANSGAAISYLTSTILDGGAAWTISGYTSVTNC
jgi:hypothetical protein